MKGVQLKLNLDLKEVDYRISELIEKNQTNWIEIAKLALVVQQKDLFRADYPSFTAWVKAIASRCERSPSLLWRYINAARCQINLTNPNPISELRTNCSRKQPEITQADLDRLDQVKSAPEVLQHLSKIGKLVEDEKVFNQLKEQALAGKLTVAKCREIKNAYRHPSSSSKVNEDVNEEENTPQIERNQIASTIKRSLIDKEQLYDWTKNCAGMKYIPRFAHGHSEVRLSDNRRRFRFDLVCVVRWSFKRPKGIFIVEIKSCLQDFLLDEKWQNYLKYCHYFCFAVPLADGELIKEIQSLEIPFIGILGIDFQAPVSLEGTYPVTIISPATMIQLEEEEQRFHKIYETLYERMVGWSGSDEEEGV